MDNCGQEQFKMVDVRGWCPSRYNPSQPFPGVRGCPWVSVDAGGPASQNWCWAMPKAKRPVGSSRSESWIEDAENQIVQCGQQWLILVHDPSMIADYGTDQCLLTMGDLVSPFLESEGWVLKNDQLNRPHD